MSKNELSTLAILLLIGAKSRLFQMVLVNILKQRSGGLIAEILFDAF